LPADVGFYYRRGLATLIQMISLSPTISTIATHSSRLFACQTSRWQQQRRNSASSIN
jgi:hypothetical protein